MICKADTRKHAPRLHCTWNGHPRKLEADLGGTGRTGFAESMQFRLQAVSIPPQLVQMLPYVFTILVLLFARRKSMAPAASGKHYYQKGE